MDDSTAIERNLKALKATFVHVPDPGSYEIHLSDVSLDDSKKNDVTRTWDSHMVAGSKYQEGILNLILMLKSRIFEETVFICDNLFPTHIYV